MVDVLIYQSATNTIMKILSSIFTLLLLVSFQSENKSLLIGRWRQVGFKAHNSNDITIKTDECSTKTMFFNADGTYEEEMYCLKSTGKWFLNKDRTKFDCTITNFNGMELPTFHDTTKFTNVILKLTNDTLIYGNEAYYGKDKIYGHDDWYFVRQK